ncbi:hypothetical protein SHKM778_47720 [Streptomyces sp. KM77-8]|uniref:Lactococcin 972 family bacteriocin n=1 Tax=Streptomyces haneummycinicus TaxID=3074435 RepID=A0AAT9HM51_9ACTN
MRGGKAMHNVSRFAVAAVGAAATVLWFSTSAHADAVVSNGYAYGGFIGYGDKIWVEHYEGRTSSVEWYTDYGRSGSCSVTLPRSQRPAITTCAKTARSPSGSARRAPGSAPTSAASQ